jgi:hypothetical protein
VKGSCSRANCHLRRQKATSRAQPHWMVWTGSGPAGFSSMRERSRDFTSPLVDLQVPPGLGAARLLARGTRRGSLDGLDEPRYLRRGNRGSISGT